MIFSLFHFICIVLFVFFSGQALSEPSHSFPLNQGLIKQIKKQGGSLVSDRVGGYILRAESLAGNKKYDQAIELLKYHYQKEGLTKLEKAHFAMHLGRLYWQNKDSKKALSYLQKALDSKTLPYHQHLSALYNLAQIHVGEENYTKALELLRLWFSINESPSPQAYILLAHCYYIKGQLDNALKYVEKTISLISKPMESWLQFAVAIYLKQKKYEKAQPHLERLAALYPSNASHWKQLAGVYLYLDKTNYAFITLDMANKMGHLKSKSDYLNLSSLYMEQGLPYQGAKLLQEKIQQKDIPKEQKNLELLADAFWMAREGKKSLIYLKEASKIAVRPLFFIKYGQRLLDQEAWKEAEKVFKKALKTKKIQDTIKGIGDYKKNMALAYKRQSDLNQRAFFQSQNTLLGDREGMAQPLDKTTVPAKDIQENENLARTNTIQATSDDPEDGSPAVKTPEFIEQSSPPTNHLESIYFGIGVALYQQKKYQEALSYFKQSIAVDDTFLSGYQWIDYTETSILEQQNKEESSLNHQSTQG